MQFIEFWVLLAGQGVHAASGMNNAHFANNLMASITGSHFAICARSDTEITESFLRKI
ncbi:hypothetical protein [Escherichia coli]|uniref:hypothetical protein n=1 Tax=Escherichia coli TaxID=562 RepID=UPI00388DF9FA